MHRPRALEPGEREALVSEAAEGDAEPAGEVMSLSSRDETANILEANAFDLSKRVFADQNTQGRLTLEVIGSFAN
ncbi:MAG: hypothetical protein IPM21_12080 [Acidobacteria bacterium]|nr:hypothetical protein [Acidobacteriota bacterium]